MKFKDTLIDATDDHFDIDSDYVPAHHKVIEPNDSYRLHVTVHPTRWSLPSEDRVPMAGCGEA